jgi:hypothetical protein
MKSILSVLFFFSVISVSLFAQGLSCSQPEIVSPGNHTLSAYLGQPSQTDATAAAWYSFTPSNSGFLTISSCGAGSDTRLIIWSGNCGNLDSLTSNDDVQSGAPCYLTDPLSSAVMDLVLIAGTTYYFEWDNIWSSSGFQWSFAFDPLPNNNDSEIKYLTNRYSKIPISQASNGITLGAAIKNLSGNNLTNVVLNVEVFELPNIDSPIETFASNPINLNVGETSTVISGVWAPNLTNASSFLIKYSKIQTEVDQVTSNDSIEQSLILDFNYMARDDNNFLTSLNFPTNGGCSQGVKFSILGVDEMTGVQYYIAPNSSPQLHSIQVFPIDNGVINSIPIYSSDNLTVNETGWVIHSFPSSLSVAAGDYLVSISNSGSTSFPLGCDLNIFTSTSNYFKEGNLAWVPIESYGYNYALMIRPKFGVDPLYDIAFEGNSNPGEEYTSIHSRQSITGNDLSFSATGKNIGTLAIQNTQLIVTLKNSSGVAIHIDSSDLQSLNPGETGLFSIPNYNVTSYDEYIIEYRFSAPSDQVLQNNIGSTNFTRSKQKMSRSLENDGSLGIGVNQIPGVYDNAILGQTFTLINDDFLDSIQFVLNPGTPANQPVRAEIYSTVAGVPFGDPIAFTETYVTTETDSLNGVSLILAISNGTLPLNSGTYFLGIIENEGDLRLATSSNYFTENRAFVRWNDNLSGAWTPIEQLNHFKAFIINPIFELCAPLQVLDSVENEILGNDGSINLTVSGGVEPYSYLWNNNSTNQDLNNIVAGTYNYTITDANGCLYSDSIIVPSTVDVNELTNYDWSLSPNPGCDIVKLNSDHNGLLSFYDLNGKLVVSSFITSLSNSVDVSRLDNGLYLVHFNGKVKPWIKK